MSIEQYNADNVLGKIANEVVFHNLIGIDYHNQVVNYLLSNYTIGVTSVKGHKEPAIPGYYFNEVILNTDKLSLESLAVITISLEKSGFLPIVQEEIDAFQNPPKLNSKNTENGNNEPADNNIFYVRVNRFPDDKPPKPLQINDSLRSHSLIDTADHNHNHPPIRNRRSIVRQ